MTRSSEGVRPEHGRPAPEVLEQAAKVVLPFAARLHHARCFGFVPSSPTWPGVLADFMAAGYNINACTWLVASGPSALELVVIDWLRTTAGTRLGTRSATARRMTSRRSSATTSASFKR